MALAMMSFANAQKPFIGKWTVGDNNIKFRVIGAGSYTWERLSGGSTEPKTGSGTFTSGLVNISLPTSTYATYQVSITPTNTFRFIYENSGLSDSDLYEFTEITQWGDVKWNPALTNMFYSCYYLKITATDIPNFSNVTDMSGLFSYCWNITTIPNIGKWDTSQVTNMSSMFFYAYNFNDDITKWNTSNVTNMSLMFYCPSNYNSKFNQPIGSWDVSKVTDMSSMFAGAKSFNQPLATWNTANVTNMSGMFSGASVFNQPIGNWTTGKVTDMGYMFYNADAFNQPLNSWDVSNVTQMGYMFYNASKFNQPLDKWNVSKVTNFESMFYNASAFNQNIGMWKLFSATYYYNNSALNSMLNNSGLDCINYGKTLQGWSSLNINNYYGMPSLGAQNLTYGTAAKPYRDALIAKGWTITGDYLDPDCTATLGVNDVKKSLSLQFFPNPTADYFMMNSLQADTLSLYDMSGKLLKTQKMVKGQNTVDITSLPKGVYIAKTSEASAKIMKK